MICVSVGERSAARCLEVLDGLRFAEVRLDLVRDAAQHVEALFAGPGKRIATCRPGRLSGAERAELLERAIAAGADYVDVELEAPLAHRRRVLRAARRAGCEVIVSFHDFEGTPARAGLERTMHRCFAAGADIAKIACTVSNPGDSARLLGLLEGGRPMVVVGMGPRGRLVRLAAPLLGSLFTYAAPDSGRPTAPGQLRAAATAAALEQLRLLGKRGRR